jgi:hypothetical protein
VLHNMLCANNGHDNLESHIEMEESDNIESDVEGDGEEYRKRALNRGRRKKPFDCVDLTCRMCHHLVLGNADDVLLKQSMNKEERSLLSWLNWQRGKSPYLCSPNFGR